MSHRLMNCDLIGPFKVTLRTPCSLQQARSVLMATIAEINYLFVGLGDGHVVSFVLDVTEDSQLALEAPKTLTFGSQPIGLTCFLNNGAACVFVASDRPAVIYSSGGKLLYANVNIGEVRQSRPHTLHSSSHALMD